MHILKELFLRCIKVSLYPETSTPLFLHPFYQGLKFLHKSPPSGIMKKELRCLGQLSCLVLKACRLDSQKTFILQHKPFHVESSKKQHITIKIYFGWQAEHESRIVCLDSNSSFLLFWKVPSLQSLGVQSEYSGPSWGCKEQEAT